ncbi:uncharacterized protein LOC144211968 [Stigmatopora nigra]
MDALKVMLLVPFTAYCIKMTVLAATDERFKNTSASYECTTDFLLTINCSLNFKSDLDVRSHLHVLTLAKRPTNRSYVCAQSDGAHLCSVTVSSTSGESCSFSDYNLFRIWLCPEKNRVQDCHELDKSYKPSKHIKPKAPCWLSVVRNASRQHFTWKNNYEKCLFTRLKDYLQYQLCFYKRRDDVRTPFWKRSKFIPTPAPYFQNLFNECHGDFKSWADTQTNVTMTLKSDDTIQVDGYEYQSPGLYENLPLHDDSLGSMPDEGKAEESPDGEHPRYSNDYCTLSALQNSMNNAGKFQSNVGKPKDSSQNVYFE